MIPARLVLASLLVLAGAGAFAQQSKTTGAASCVNPPCASNLVWPGLGEPPPAPGAAPGAEPVGSSDICRHMSADERRKHPLTCGTGEPDARTGTAPPPAKSP
jgi:hypothetical protein